MASHHHAAWPRHSEDERATHLQYDAHHDHRDHPKQAVNASAGYPTTATAYPHPEDSPYDADSKRIRRRPVPLPYLSPRPEAAPTTDQQEQEPQQEQQPQPQPGSAPSNLTSFRPRPASSDMTAYETMRSPYYEPSPISYWPSETHHFPPIGPHGTPGGPPMRSQTIARPSNLHVWEDQSPLRRTQSVFASPDRPTRDVDAFDDISQFHLFVEATSGLPSFSPFSPSTPPVQNPWGSQQNHQPGPYGSAVFPHPREIPTRDYPAPSQQYESQHQHSQSQPQLQAPPQPRRMPYSYPGPQAPASLSTRQEATRNHMLAMMNVYEQDQPQDDELPDYEQSQLEATQAQRRQAALRARELERRWRERERSRR